MANVVTAPGVNGSSNQVVPLSVFADHTLNHLLPENWPNQAWSTNHQLYDLWWGHYQGYTLNEEEDGLEIYPVKLNIIRPAVINHAAVQLGQFSDDEILTFSIRDNKVADIEVRDRAKQFMNVLWSVNDGDDLLLEQSIYTQVMGGCFWKIAWQPTRRTFPIRYFSVDPRACFPVWDSDDQHRLVSMDVMHQVPRPTAVARFGMKAEMFSEVPSEPEFVNIHDHWDENEYFIKIDGVTGVWPDGKEMQGPNPFFDPVLGKSLIPFVYAPRLRAGNWYGDSMIPGMMGPQTEENNNLAHLMEGLADAMHQQPWVRNRPAGVQGMERDRRRFLNLGMAQPGANREPEIGRLDGAEITPAMKDLVTEDLIRLARESNNMPNVAYGHTDASIRSALTLKYMMWPAINVGLRYRKHASTAFKWMNYAAMVVAYTANTSGFLGNSLRLGVDNADEKMIEAVITAHRTHWPPMLPDDRTELVNEVVQRIASETISPHSAVRRLDGDDELEEELKRIKAHRETVQEAEVQMAETTAKAQADARAAQFQNQPSNRTNKKQAEGGRNSQP